MGVPYLSPDEIRACRADLIGRMRKPSWIVRRETERGELSDIVRARFGLEARVLELGVANGRVLKSFSEKGFNDIVGVDIDDYLEFQELRPLLRIADLNRDSIPADDNSADAVLALEVFEHLENPWHVARECARVLRPGGLLIFSTPWGRTIWDKWLFFWRGRLLGFHPGNNHITYLSRDLLGKAFGKKFEVKRMFFDRGWIPFLRPRRWNKFLPPHSLWSLKVCYVMERKG